MSETSKLPVYLLLLAISVGGSLSYDVPKATVKVIFPIGFEVSIPDESGISLFAFHGKVNEDIYDLSDQTWAADIIKSRNGRWTYRNRNQKLRPGDALYYWTTARYYGIDYHNYNQEYVVSRKDFQRFDENGTNVDNQPTLDNSQTLDYEITGLLRYKGMYLRDSHARMFDLLHLPEEIFRKN